MCLKFLKFKVGRAYEFSAYKMSLGGQIDESVMDQYMTIIYFQLFLVACTRLSMPLCWLVGPSVGRSVGRSVRPLVGWSVGR